MVITRERINYWPYQQSPSIRRANAVADFFNFTFDWMMKGRGHKYWTDQAFNTEGQPVLNVTPITDNTKASSKIIEIISSADKAMNDSRCEFTDDERLDYYLEALEFAGRKEFSPDFIRQYVKEIIKEK